MDDESRMTADKYVGFCKFCGQGVSIDPEDEYWESIVDVNDIASMRCRCFEGEEFRRAEHRKEDARSKILENVPEETLKDIMLSLVDPLIEGNARSFSIDRDGCKVKMKLNKDGRVQIRIKLERNSVIE